MKKVLVILLAVVLAAAATVGIVLGVQSCQNKNEDTDTIKGSVEYLDDTYRAGDDIVIRVVCFSDRNLTAIKYSIDNGLEVAMTCTTGDAEDSSRYSIFKFGDNYIDSGTETIATDDFETGEHILKIYAYEGTSRYQVNSAYIFEIVDAD